MYRRFLKQILYGAFYIFIAAIFVFALYIYFGAEPTCFDNRKNQGEEDVDCGGPCQSCEIKRLLPLQISRERILPVSQSSVSLSAEVRNPNFTFGLERFSYRWEIYDPSGNLLQTLTAESFIYPNEVKYLIVPEVNIAASAVGSVKLISGDQHWLPAASFPLPRLESIRVRTAVSENRLETTGAIVNNEAFHLRRLRVIGVLFDSSGQELAVSATELRDVRAFEERFFSLVFPRSIDPAAVDFSKTRVFAETKLVR